MALGGVGPLDSHDEIPPQRFIVTPDAHNCEAFSELICQGLVAHRSREIALFRDTSCWLLLGASSQLVTG